MQKQKKAPARRVTAPPGSRIPCRSDLVGAVVPGRGGGLVTSCAAPPRREPRRRYVFVQTPGGLPGLGHSMHVTRARRRIRAGVQRLTSLDAAYLYDAHTAFRRTGIPAPSGVEFPHRAGTSVCDPEHAVWQGYEEARNDAAEAAAIQAGDDDAAYVAAMLRELSKHPRFELWERTARGCARAFDDRREAKATKREGSEWERAQIRKAARRVGRDEDERDALGGDYLSEAMAKTRDSSRKASRKGGRR